MNERCLYWNCFKGYNNRRVVDLITTNIDTEDEEQVYETILHVIEARMNKGSDRDFWCNENKR